MHLYLTLQDPARIAAREATAAAADALAAIGDYDGMRAILAARPSDPDVQAPCESCGQTHAKLWRVTRALVDTLGHFPVVRMNGARIVPDMSIPYHVTHLPRDAWEVPADLAARIWHDDSDSHTFGRTHTVPELVTREIR